MKKTNKGFSLVELIIVIAIMAILAGAIAPALIRYIDKSRKSNDVTAAKAIKTAVETAMGNENIYELFTGGKPGAGECTAVIKIEPGVKTETGTATSKDNTDKCITLGLPAKTTYSDPQFNGKDTTVDLYKDTQPVAKKEIATNIGEKMPKCKYKKNASQPKSTTADRPKTYVATCSAKGTVNVYVVCTNFPDTPSIDWKPADGIGKEDQGKADPATVYMLVPEVSSYYQ